MKKLQENIRDSVAERERLQAGLPAVDEQAEDQDRAAIAEAKAMQPPAVPAHTSLRTVLGQLRPTLRASGAQSHAKTRLAAVSGAGHAQVTDRDSPTVRSASGITTIAFVGAGHTLAQMPHPVHTSARIVGLHATTSMAPGTGQRSEHTVQNEPVWARQAIVWIQATPIFRG